MKNTCTPRPPAAALHTRQAQAGVVMLFGLIVLAIMMIGAAAMVRSMNTSLFNAGNLGFKRDMTNQGERAVLVVRDLLVTGALSTDVSRHNSDTTRNYSATILPSNPQGIPVALLNGTTFATVGTSGNDIVLAGQGITVRYLVDRLCTTSGPQVPGQCTMADDPTDPSGNATGGGVTTESLLAADRVVYRVSIRVTGPRNTQAFYQSTLTL